MHQLGKEPVSTKIAGPIKPPSPQTIEAYRAALRAYRTSYRPVKRECTRDELLIPITAAAVAVKKLLPALTDSEAEALARDAIIWAEQVPNESFWDL